MLYLGKIRSEIDTMLTFPCGKTIIDHALQQRLHVIVETVEIVENARLRQLVKANLRHNLTDLLQRSRAAGEGDEHVAKLDHASTPFGDVRHDGELGQILVRDTLVHERRR